MDISHDSVETRLKCGVISSYRFVMAAWRSRFGHNIFILWFLLLSSSFFFFSRLISAVVSWLRYCSDVAHLRPTKRCTIFSRLLGWYTYIFGGSFPLTEFCPLQNSLSIQVLRSPILAALLHGTPIAGVSQTLRRGTRNGITELLQRVPAIFGWAAITLSIGPHSTP